MYSTLAFTSSVTSESKHTTRLGTGNSGCKTQRGQSLHTDTDKMGSVLETQPVDNLSVFPSQACTVTARSEGAC